MRTCCFCLCFVLLIGNACRAEEIDKDVEETLAKLAFVEAQTMLEQANQYKAMGIRHAEQSAVFLWKEIVRRFPDTDAAHQAKKLLDEHSPKWREPEPKRTRSKEKRERWHKLMRDSLESGERERKRRQLEMETIPIPLAEPVEEIDIC